MPQLQIDDAVSTMNLDTRARTLHLLPVLQVDPFDGIALEDITLSVSASWLDTPVIPATGWTLRQPYPNRLYFVGGSDDCHLGHFITLPEGQKAGEVTFHWSVDVSALPPGHFQITHRLDLAFEEGAGNTWSMDIANWWAQSEFATEEHVAPEIGRNRFSRLKRQGFSPSRRAHVSEALRDGCRYLDIHESLELPAITLGDCWTIDTYGGDTVHECLEALR
ncbi:hypothetical protein [Salinicola rhizosphaerae]|uniref:Uncharacterized protein n=1 Tax=Salinicola rhizosphaerae TaxID=1443141 RepID=A0ABQ3ECM0_9GAMM|nr:hypothetical protein [Salinicola rhizosphaerae]GHB26578.1 hypothetical protein GCM10009038_26540 [Salinicola rhizosphaerae]